MLCYVQITDDPVRENRGTIARGPNQGKPYHMVTQNVYLWQGGQFPEKFEVTLDTENGQLPYKPGLYLPAAGSFERVQPSRAPGADNTRAGHLGLSRRLNLIPFAEARSKMDDVERASRPASVKAA